MKARPHAQVDQGPQDLSTKAQPGRDGGSPAARAQGHVEGRGQIIVHAVSSRSLPRSRSDVRVRSSQGAHHM